jgi:O-antigen/teichoic acid export membrane protein
MKKTNSLIQKLRNFGFFVFFNAQGEFFIAYTDILAITFFRTLEEVGLYSAAVPIIALIMFIPFSLNSILMPTISEIWTKKRKDLISTEVQRIQKYALIAIIPIALSLFAFSDVAIRIFFGEKYVVASIILKILSIGAIINTLAVINKEILNGIGKPSVNSRIIFTAVVINLIGCLVFVPIYGMIAAALSTVFSYFVIFLLNSRQISKEIGPNISVMDSIKLFISGLLFLGTISLFKLVEMNIWLKIIIAIIVASMVYMILLFLFKSLTKKEIILMKKRVSS